MAKRHFDARGFPDLDLIRSEICSFSEENTSRAINRLSRLRGATGFSLDQLENVIRYLNLFGRYVPVLPRVNGIYVVGSQAEHLPAAYLTGEHDLDLIMQTTPAESSDGGSPIVHRNTLRELLRHFMNNPTKKLTESIGKKTVSREFFIDVYDETMLNGLKKPYLQIHPAQL